MAKIRELSDGDVVTLRKLIERERQRILNEIEGNQETHLHTPDCFIAKIPAEGIPALIEGTDDVPGSAECDLYQVVKDGADYKVLQAYGTRLVFNASSSDLSEGYQLIHRDKPGRWVAGAAGGGAGGAPTVYGSINSPMALSTPQRTFSVYRVDVGPDPGSIVIVKNQPDLQSGGYIFQASAGAPGLAYKSEDGNWYFYWVKCSNATIPPQETEQMTGASSSADNNPENVYLQAASLVNQPPFDPFLFDQQPTPYFDMLPV